MAISTEWAARLHVAVTSLSMDAVNSATMGNLRIKAATWSEWPRHSNSAWRARRAKLSLRHDTTLLRRVMDVREQLVFRDPCDPLTASSG